MIREFRLNGWRVQPQFHQLVGPGGAVEVEAHSMGVLVVLAEQAGEVVSREELLETVWGSRIVEEGALTHAVWDLRRALDDDPKDPEYIQTLPKRGYRLIAKVAWLERGFGETERYRLLEKIGGGGMRVVFKAEDTRLRRFVALKFLPPEWSRDTLAKERFLREARVAAALDHPNLCTLHEIDETEDGRLFLVMALYEGETLRERLRRGPLKPDEALEVGMQVAGGLSALHGSGIVHRDIKPGNIMLPAADQARILDFGLAKFAGGTQLTKTGSSPGTPRYMSPEQVQGREVDARSDVWSLGAVLFEMLSGRPPFRSDDHNALLMAICGESAPALEIEGDESAQELAAIVGRALAKSREERFANAGELLQGLRGCRLVGAGSDGAPARVLADRTTERKPRVAKEGVQEHPRDTRFLGRRALIGGAILVAVALAITLVQVLPPLVSRLPSEPGQAAAPTQRSSEVERLMLRGRHYLERGDLKESLENAELVYRRALDLEPENNLVKAELAALLVRIQSQFPLRERAEEIKALANEALQSGQPLAAAWFALGRLTLLEGTSSNAASEALEAANLAIEAGPEDYRGYTLSGQSLIRMRRVEEGLARLRQGAGIGAGFITARLSLARSLENVGRSDEATAEYQKVLEYAPDSPAALNNLASIYVQTGRDRDAIPHLLALLDEEPDEDRAWSTLGYAYFNLDRMDEAVEAFQHANELAPGDAAYMRNLGDSYEKLGDGGKADEWFEKAAIAFGQELTAGGHRYWALAGRAVCLAKLGRFSEAIRDMDEALTLSPNESYLFFVAAQVHALAGNREKTLHFTREAIRTGLSREEFGRDLCFEQYRADPEFQALLDR